MTLLNPNQIIGMNDYPPLHSPQAFNEYKKDLEEGKSIKPAPVMPIEIVLPFLASQERYQEYKTLLDAFLEENPDVEYFALGAKHRSAAATVTLGEIPCKVITSTQDIIDYNRDIPKEKFIALSGMPNDLEANLQELEEHYHRTKRFWTVETKVQLMINNGALTLT